MKSIIMRYEFVDCVPSNLEDFTLYVAMKYATVIHKCCCGCGRQVVTPLNPTGWKLTYDGETISLSPSIGNWNFPCKSHYFIRQSRIVWADKWSKKQIDAVQSADLDDRRKYYGQEKAPIQTPEQTRKPQNFGFWARVRIWIFGK